MNNALFKKIATSIYGSGMIVSIGMGIYDANMRLEEKSKRGEDIQYTDYAMHSYGGACAGVVCGIMWPATVIGRVSVMLFSPKQ